ncbi:MAG: mannonate dehydratase [Acidobacteria bacterium]|nr:mannonate dehydratase [Acidobacteriota bacterium]
MLNRREFLGTSLPSLLASASGAAGLSPAELAVHAGPRMKLGCQSGPVDNRRLQFFRRHGVESICGSPPRPRNGRIWGTDELEAFKEDVESHGIALEMVAPPFLESTHVNRTDRPAIVLGRSPERDRDIEDIQTLIRNCARAGIPAIKYNLSLLGVLRTDSTPGRGGTRLSTWNLAEAAAQAWKMTRAGRVTAEIFWERIAYFLERVIPVADEYRIRMACHPHDPGVPPGFSGVDRVLGTVEGLKKFVSINESPYHGLNFCQGTVSEMLENPAAEIYDVIRYFGSRKKIFNVHFRNIRGRRDSFQETYPDEGDIDMVRALRAYRDVGYAHMLMPDHVPRHSDDPEGLQAFAFCYGYIRALMQASESAG